MINVLSPFLCGGLETKTGESGTHHLLTPASVLVYNSPPFAVVVYFEGSGVNLRYSFPDGTLRTSTPFGNREATSSGFTDGTTIHFSPL